MVGDGYDRDVVGLLRPRGVLAHRVEDAEGRVTRAPRRGSLEVRKQTLLAEELLVAVEGLTDAVSEEDERLAFLQIQRFAGNDAGRQQSEHACGGGKGKAGWLPRDHTHRPMVSCAGARHAPVDQVE